MKREYTLSRIKSVELESCSPAKIVRLHCLNRELRTVCRYYAARGVPLVIGISPLHQGMRERLHALLDSELCETTLNEYTYISSSIRYSAHVHSTKILIRRNARDDTRDLTRWELKCNTHSMRTEKI